MQFYLAPLEGITGYIYRNAVHEFFGEGLVKYFTPFIAPRQGRGMKRNEERDLLPENNCGLKLIPQLLTRSVEDFLRLSEQIHAQYGYEEINLNAGCPSKTVTTHGKGAAILKDTEELDRFLDGIFSGSRRKLSVKTRLGLENEEEFGPILEVYKHYPLSELIIHPRTQADGYGGTVRMASFRKALEECPFPVVYNGDIFRIEDYDEKMNALRVNESDAKLPAAVMLGRGLLMDPALARKLSRHVENKASGSAETEENDGSVSLKELRAFHDRIFSSYEEIFDGDTPLLFHMKELWGYMGRLFPDDAKKLKSIRKAVRKADYLSAVSSILGPAIN